MIRNMHFETVPLADLPLRELTDLGGQLKPVVLVVNNEPLIADTRAMILERNGITAMVAYDAESALKIANTFPPDLLLTDDSMMNGIELALSISRFIPSCSILICAEEALGADLLKAPGVAEHELKLIIKPLHPRELVARVSDELQSRICADPNE
jgi:DNA-binding response OmpR family regulator